jgi:peptidoglycan/xylan/chitin deacetylase (PgdA/CDA1 family)
MKRAPSPVLPIILVRGAQTAGLALLLHWLGRWPFTGPHALGLVLIPLLCLSFVFTFVAPWAWGLPILTRLPTRERRVALTFDDGPSPETTPEILGILRRYDTAATFFVLGEAAERHPDLVRRILIEGHALGIHAFRHRSLVLAPPQAVRRELERALDAVRRACPNAPPPCWFRPPYGFKTLALPFLARRAGCRMVTWSIDPRDYARRSPERIAAAVLSALHPGAIVLLHDGPGAAATRETLPQILDGLRARGYRSVPLFSREPPERI